MFELKGKKSRTSVIRWSAPVPSSSLNKISLLKLGTRSWNLGSSREICPSVIPDAPSVFSATLGTCCLNTNGVNLRADLRRPPPLPGPQHWPQEPQNIRRTAAHKITRRIQFCRITYNINKASPRMVTCTRPHFNWWIFVANLKAETLPGSRPHPEPISSLETPRVSLPQILLRPKCWLLFGLFGGFTQIKNNFQTGGNSSPYSHCAP